MKNYQVRWEERGGKGWKGKVRGRGEFIKKLPGSKGGKIGREGGGMHKKLPELTTFIF